MCLTAEALAAFLTLIGPEKITSHPDAITIHATAGDVVWLAADQFWCMRPDTAPQAAATS